MNVRLLASRVIDEVANGRSLSDCLANTLPTIKDPRDRAFLQAICYGVCRHYSRLDFVLSQLLQKPMNEKDGDVHALLLVGLYQLMDMRVPPHAAVAETVNATVKLKKSWARGFTNAILREYLRQHEALEAELDLDIEAFFSHPWWWIDALKTAWPEQWEKILHDNNEHPPFSLRVNQRHMLRDQYVELLKAKELAAEIIPETVCGVTLTTPIQAEDLPGFAAGDVSVQDGAAQLAVELLELAPQQRVLDACSAPGGKLMHILESQPDLAACVAVEKDAKRMLSIKENLQRLQLSAECICADVGAVDQWWDGKLFDRILLDAPCSASGVIRRHPDIKLLRVASDIEEFAKEQFYLLSSLWPLLKPGGMLIYATCSIFPQENVDVMQRFFDAHADATERVIDTTWGLPCKIGRQILPGMHGMDGFYYARVLKG